MSREKTQVILPIGLKYTCLQRKAATPRAAQLISAHTVREAAGKPGARVHYASAGLPCAERTCGLRIKSSRVKIEQRIKKKKRWAYYPGWDAAKTRGAPWTVRTNS